VIDLIDALPRDLITRRGIPGMAIANVNDGRLVFARGYGVRGIPTQEPVTTETVFQLASVSKSVSGSAAASVVGKGVLEWRSNDQAPALVPAERSRHHRAGSAKGPRSLQHKTYPLELGVYSFGARVVPFPRMTPFRPRRPGTLASDSHSTDQRIARTMQTLGGSQCRYDRGSWVQP
jgi:hypothetical protein